MNDINTHAKKAEELAEELAEQYNDVTILCDGAGAWSAMITVAKGRQETLFFAAEGKTALSALEAANDKVNREVPGWLLK